MMTNNERDIMIVTLCCRQAGQEVRAQVTLKVLTSD